MNEEQLNIISVLMDESIDERLDKGLELDGEVSIPSIDMLRQINKHIKGKRMFKVVSIMAAFTLVLSTICVWIVLERNSRVNLLSKETRTICVPSGERMTVLLQDGTKITMNSESSLEYPMAFANGNRRVSLTGEAFFEVARDEKRPFMVRTDFAELTVLGTKFNIDADETDNEMSVYLEEGSVSVMEKVTGTRRSVVLVPDDYLLINKRTGDVKVYPNTNKEEAKSWLRRAILFHNTPFDNVLRQLGRQYGVTFNVEDCKLSKYTYTVSFYDESLNDILSTIETMTPVKFVRRDDNDSFDVYAR